jgi:hypothetical protein
MHSDLPKDAGEETWSPIGRARCTTVELNKKQSFMKMEKHILSMR